MLSKLRFLAAIAVLGLTPIALRAQSFADVTGGNVWNNPVPIFAPEDLDPDLLAQIEQVNRDGAIAYQACDRAVVEAQQTNTGARRYARPDSPVSQPAPPAPAACLRYSAIVTEANNLRRVVAEIEQTRLNPDFYTW